jgi:hypothetical protein
MTFDDVYEDLLMIASEWGVRVGIPIECDFFFRNQVDIFKGSKEEFLEYIKIQMPIWFRSAGSLPNWIHECEWQFHEGKPMLFVGQHDISGEQSGLHDDSSIFVFWDPPSRETKVVIQTA